MSRPSSNRTASRRLLPSPETPLQRDVLTYAPYRLAIAALALFAVLLVNLLIYDVLPYLGGPDLGEESFGPMDFVVIALLLVSAGVYFLARSERIRSQKLLDIGILYEIALALGLSLGMYLGLEREVLPRNGVSWICVLILFFPVIVPNTPIKTLAAALIVATIEPVAAVLSTLQGRAYSTDRIFEAFYPNYVCAMMAVFQAHVIHRLGREVKKARELGSYRLGDRLGKGGMGEVWRASHYLLAREAAIKIIQPEMLKTRTEDAGMILERFRREAEATAALQSPHTIELYDFGVTEEGTFYYVMELLDGFDLQTMVERFGPLPAERVCYLLKQACHSLGDAHAQGLVHRDVKPANLFACRKGQDHDFVKVLDFGLVKSTALVPMGDAMKTGDQALLGTPAFMAPEMITSRPLDGRADLYALGCVAYWLLTGGLVFDARQPMELLMQHVGTAPEPPSRATENRIPAELDRLVLACLAKRPEERPESAEHLSRLLDTVVFAEPWTLARARQWWETNWPKPNAGGRLPPAEPSSATGSDARTVATQAPLDGR